MQLTITCGSGTNWWPIAIGGLQFAIGLALTIYTFRKSFRQKAEERKASWYHKVVVDRAIELLFKYLDAERIDIEKAALRCEMARSGGSLGAAQVEVLYGSALADFQERLRPVRAELTNLALIFDRKLFDRIQAAALQFDDSISQWFYEARSVGTLRVSKSAAETLSDFHRDILTVLRDYEFTVLPKAG